MFRGMSTLSVAEIANLQPTCPIRSVAGRIDKLFPIERPRGWCYQNGFLKDEASNTEIRFQLKNWDREVSVSDYQGGFIELTATDDEALVWKKQPPRASEKTPIVKLEILKTATVVRLLTAAEYRARGSAPRPPVTGAPSSRVPVPDAPTPFPTPPGAKAAYAAVTAGHNEVQQEIRQLASLYLLCAEEAAALPAPTGEPVNVAAATEQIFNHAAGQGAHHKIDLASFWTARDPERAAKLGYSAVPAKLPQHVARMAELIGENEERERKANKMLRELQHITHEQTWRDLSDAKAKEILDAGFFQVALAA